MVPWSHWRQPFLGWMMTVLISEFTHFNLVIRLSIVQQSALRFISLFESPAAPSSLEILVNCILHREKSCGTTRNSFFRHCSLSFRSSTWHVRLQATGMSFSCRCGLSGIWWGQTYCAPNSMEFESRFMPLWLTGTRAWIGTTHEF